MPDGSPLTHIPKLADHIDDGKCLECQGAGLCGFGPLCVMRELNLPNEVDQ